LKLKSRIVTNVLTNGATTFYGFILSMILSPIVVQGLGNSWYGVWVIIMQISNYIWLLDLGIRDSVVRYVSKHLTEKDYGALNKIVSTSFYLYFVVAIVTLIIFIVVSIFFKSIFNVSSFSTGQTEKIVILLVGLNMAQGWMFNAYTGVIIGMQRFDLLNGISVVSSLLRFSLTIIFLKLGCGIVTLTLIMLISSVTQNFMIYFMSKRLIPQLAIIRYRREDMQFGSIGKFSLFVFINNIASKIIFMTDTIVIGIFLSVSDVTFYSIPASLVEYARNAIRSMAHIVYPLTSMLEASEDKQSIAVVFTHGIKYLLLLGIPVFCGYLILGRNFISIWMGNEYAVNGIHVLIILSVGHLLSIIHYPIHYMLLGISKHHIVAYLRVTESLFNIILSIILLHYYGIVGVALGTVIPHILIMVIVLPCITCKLLKVRFLEFLRYSLVRPLLVAAVFCSCCFLAQYLHLARNLATFFLQVFSVSTIYLLIVYAIGLNKKERFMLQDYLRSLLKNKIVISKT